MSNVQLGLILTLLFFLMTTIEVRKTGSAGEHSADPSYSVEYLLDLCKKIIVNYSI